MGASRGQLEGDLNDNLIDTALGMRMARCAVCAPVARS
jgi:hypothetical protein